MNTKNTTPLQNSDIIALLEQLLETQPLPMAVHNVVMAKTLTIVEHYPREALTPNLIKEWFQRLATEALHETATEV